MLVLITRTGVKSDLFASNLNDSSISTYYPTCQDVRSFNHESSPYKYINRSVFATVVILYSVSVVVFDNKLKPRSIK